MQHPKRPSNRTEPHTCNPYDVVHRATLATPPVLTKTIEGVLMSEAYAFPNGPREHAGCDL